MKNYLNILLWLLLSLTLLLISGISYQLYLRYELDTINSKKTRITTLQEVFNEVEELEFAFFHEKDLVYIEKINKLVEKFNEINRQEYKNDYWIFTRFYSEIEILAIQKYETMILQYISSLQEIMKLTTTLGLDHTKGLYVQLRQHAHLFEEVAVNKKDMSMAYEVLQMRRHEKDFMLRKLDKYITKFVYNETKLRELIANAKQKKLLTKLLDDYSSSFYSYVKVAKTISTLSQETKNLREDFNTQAHLTVAEYLKLHKPLDSHSDSVSFVIFLNFLLLITVLFFLRKEMKHAVDINPLTGLNGNHRITSYLKEVIKMDCYRTVIYFDIDNFKPFNDRFGFKVGDEVILLFSELLKKSFSKRGYFIGHIGGDDFVVVHTKSNFEKSHKKVAKLRDTFQDEAKKYYDDKEISQGYYVQKDRFGVERKTPLISVSAAILQIHPRHQPDNYEEIVKQVNKIKTLSKEMGISAISYWDSF